MRYMMLVYSAEGPDGSELEEAGRMMAGHRKVMEEATRKGVYVIDCDNLEWAAKIPTACQGREGCIEIRPMRWQPSRAEPEAMAQNSASLNV